MKKISLRHSESTSGICFAGTGSAEQKDVMPLRNVVAGGQPRYQVSVGVVLYVFNTGAGFGELRLLDESF